MSMDEIQIPTEVSKRWDVILLLISSEEKKIDRTTEGEVDTMAFFIYNDGIRRIHSTWLEQMQSSYGNTKTDMDTANKCDDIASRWRVKGNDEFRENLLKSSYDSYTKSLMYATHKGLQYGLALANRSAVLLRQKKFQESLLDIAKAVYGGYPEDQIQKLILRKADCLIELNQKPLAREVFQEAEDYAKSVHLSPQRTVEFKRRLRELKEKCDSPWRGQPLELDPVLPKIYKGDNPNFENASMAIELRRNETAGRHVVTTDSTSRGDVLFSEEPYAWVTLEKNVCHYCCSSPINPMPCLTCSRAEYCSEECVDLAQKFFHQWECVGMQMNLFETVGIAHLALRVLLMSASNGFPALVGRPKKARDLFRAFSDVDTVEIYEEDTHPFLRMFSLVTNFDKMNNTDYIQYAVTATMLIHYLEEYTEFMPFLSSRLPKSLELGEAEVFAGALVLRAMGQLICNGHAALSLITIDDGDAHTVTEREMRKATGIYPSAAMMNHSCDPNIINTFFNRRLIIRCSRELAANTEVQNCYGPHKSRQTASRRKALLRSQYMFNCTCVACTDVDRKDFVLLFSAYACQTCRGPVVCQENSPKCSQCNTVFQLEKALNTIDRSDDLMVQANQTEDLEVRSDIVCAALRLRQQVWHRHHTSLRVTIDKLARILADLGEFSRSIELIKQNIQSLEYQFGSFSVEVAHELRKLSDVMLQRIMNPPDLRKPEHREWCLEAHKITKKAVQLIELNYGSWEPLAKKLNEQEAIVARFLAESSGPDTVDCIHRNMHYNLKI